MLTARDDPYIWVTWLTRLLVGENSCEWAAWFKAHYQGYRTMPSNLDATAWQMDHTALVNRLRDRLTDAGHDVRLADQNAFRLKGTTATLGGKPDLVSLSGGAVTVIDAKTGKPGTAHEVQVLLYMYALPRALPEYRGLTVDGLVVYANHEVQIGSEAVDAEFTDHFSGLIKRIASGTPARKVPSAAECRFCEITAADCPKQIGMDAVEPGQTDDF